MKINRPSGSAAGNAPKATGGYNYSTDRSQNILFNQGLDPQDPGAGDMSYDYSAKGRADRLLKMQGNSTPSSLGKPGEQAYGTAFNKAATLRKVNGGLNGR